MKKYILAIAALISYSTLFAQIGNLDPSFGNHGLVQTDFSTGTVYGNDCRRILINPDGSFYLVFEMNRQVFITHRRANGTLDLNYGQGGYSVPVFMSNTSAVMQRNGKIVVGGTVVVDGPSKFGLARFNSNGTLDKSFGLNGMQTTSFSGISDNLTALALQEDGKIVAVGGSYDYFSDRIVMARYNTDGSPDNSFSEDGKQSTTISGHDGASAVTLQKDGKIVVAGYSNFSGTYTFAVVRYTAKGNPDSSFASSGILTFATGSYSIASSIVVQNDGTIVVGGISMNSTNGTRFTIARLLENGMPDISFSSDGEVIDDFGAIESSISAMVVQNDGKLLVAGFAGQPGNRDFIVVRYNVDGTRDNSFSDDGFLLPGVNAGEAYPFAEAKSMALLPDGKIMVAGSCASPQQYAAVRINPNGSMDNSFDGDGILKDHKAGGQSVYNASAVQPDGRLVTAGQASVSNQGQMTVIVARYNTDGSFDRNFSGDGKVLIDFPYSSANAHALAIQQDGKIVVAGTAYNGSTTDFMVLRLTRDGSLDKTFGSNGVQMTDFGGYEEAYSLAIQPDGKILLAGEANDSRESVFALARYNTDGTLDNGFSGDGKQTTSFSLGSGGVNALLLQPDGKIIAVGSSRYLFALARYNSDGSPDLSFDGDGVVTTDLNGLHAQASAAVLSPDGAIIAAGVSEEGFTLARYNGNGTLDHGFSGDGILTIGFGPGSAIATSLVIQPDGKLIAGGTANYGFKVDFALARINKDGTLDSSFSADGKQQMDIGNGEDLIQSLSLGKNRLYATGRTTYGGQLATVAAFIIGCPLDVRVPDAFALSSGVNANTVYPGYTPAEDITLTAVPSGGKAPFTYLWSNGATTVSTTVMPASATTYSVTVYDARGCSNKVGKQISVVEVSCGSKEKKVLVCHAELPHFSSARVDCININAVGAALKNGAYLGNCDAGCATKNYINFNYNGNLSELEIYPNPSSTTFHILARSAENNALTIMIWDGVGRLVETIKTETNRPIELGAAYRPGIYFFELFQGNATVRGKLVKNGN